MFNFDITEYQKTFTEQAEKVRSLTEKALKLNTEFAEAAIARQTQVATEFAKTNTEYAKGLADIEKLKNIGTETTEQLAKDGEHYFTDIKESLSSIYDENVTSLKKYQSSLEKVVTELSSVATPKKAPVKKAAKS